MDFGKFIVTVVFAVTVIGLGVITMNISSFDKAHPVASAQQ